MKSEDFDIGKIVPIPANISGGEHETIRAFPSGFCGGWRGLGNGVIPLLRQSRPASPLAIREELHHRRGIAVALSNLGAVALRLGNLDRADTLFAQGLRMFEADRDVQGMAPTTLGLAEIAHQQGDLARAAALGREALALARSVLATGEVPECLEVLAAIALEDHQPERATRLLGASDAMRTDISRPPPAYERDALEQCLTTARAALGETEFTSAWRAGATTSFDDILDYALAQPSQPAETEHTGLLSAREHEVARLIATGLTNRQIAEYLVVSERTVDAHCRHIFDKLGVTSRAQVAAWAVVNGLSTR